MPEILEKAVKAIKKSSPGVNPWAVGTATLQKAGELKPGTNQPTKLGVKRGKMSRKERHAKPLAIGGAAKRPHLGRKGPWRNG
jgi:hypothetical protein